MKASILYVLECYGCEWKGISKYLILLKIGFLHKRVACNTLYDIISTKI